MNTAAITHFYLLLRRCPTCARWTARTRRSATLPSRAAAPRWPRWRPSICRAAASSRTSASSASWPGYPTQQVPALLFIFISTVSLKSQQILSMTNSIKNISIGYQLYQPEERNSIMMLSANMKWMSFSGCAHLTDESLRHLRKFSKTLHYVDFSGCSRCVLVMRWC